MSPAARAIELRKVIWKDAALHVFQSREPLVSEIPSDATHSSYGVMINTCVDPALVSLPILWRLTVVLMRQLFQERRLGEFTWVGMQVVGVGSNLDLGRILRVECKISEIGNLLASCSEDLLNGAKWNEDRFSCRWYWNKESVRASGKTGRL